MEHNALDTLKQIWPEWQVKDIPIGSGSYGKVYKAIRKDYQVESYAAIKVISIPPDSLEVDSLLSEGLDADAGRTYLRGIVNDFVSEIQVMESLKGARNIVSVEDYKVVERDSQIGWDIFIRMELLTPFNTYICDKRLTEGDVIKLGCDICTALDICGKRNIIHRDIKPENIFINDFGDFKLGDFGIARNLENVSGNLSQKGTVNYMAPEVTNSGDYDARADIYSLGLVLYRLLNNNRLPFLDTDKQLLSPNERRKAVSRRLRGEALPAPQNASPIMASLILRACAYDPDKRFASASAMRQALLCATNSASQVAADQAKITHHQKPSHFDWDAAVRQISTSSEHRNSDSASQTAADRTEIINSQKSSTFDWNSPVSESSAAGRKRSKPVVHTFGRKPKVSPKALSIIAATVAVLILMIVEAQFAPDLLAHMKGTQKDSTSGDILTMDPVEPDGGQTDFVSGEPGAETAKPVENTQSESADGASEQVSCVYLGKDIQAYNNGLYYEEYDGKSTFNLAGATYKYGFTIGTYEYGGTANFNLGGKYKYFAGVAGNVDGVNCSVTYDVLGDDELLGTVSIRGMLLPTSFEFDVSGVKQLTIVATGDDNYAEGVGFGNAVLYNEVSDKPTLYESINLPDTAYLGVDIKSYVSSGLYYEEYDGMSAFKLAGEPYTKGFTIGTYPYVGYTSFNIGGQYTTLTGVAGNVDGVNCPLTYIVIGDGNSIGTIEIKGGGLPTEFSFDVTGITQLGFIVNDSDSNYGSGVGFGNVFLQ